MKSNRLHSVSKDHEVETSSAIALLTFVMKQNLNFQNISAHKGPVEQPTKFLIHLFINKLHQKAWYTHRASSTMNCSTKSNTNIKTNEQKDATVFSALDCWP